MTHADPVDRLTSTYDTGDLAALVDGEGPFLTVVLRAPSHHDDAAHRLDVRWRNARREAEGRWPAEHLADLDQLVGTTPHDEAAAFAIVQRADGHTLVEAMTIDVDRDLVVIDALPRLVPIIEHRQRTLPHVVVATDRAGADIVAFDGGAVVADDEVLGDTEHLHRGHPGGWSQRRFQQRAENTWERNASDVATAVADLARRVDPVLVVVTGEVRARSLVLDALDTSVADRIEGIEAGDAADIADVTLRLVADQHARIQRAALDRLRSEHGLTDPGEVIAALDEGRVGTLLVDDDPSGRSPGDDAVDRAVAAALRTSARIVVVPRVAEMDGGVAATTRW